MRRSSRWVVAGVAFLSSLGLATSQSFAQCATGGCSTDGCGIAPSQIFGDPGCSAGGCGMDTGACSSLTGLFKGFGSGGCGDGACGIGDIGGCGEGCGSGGSGLGDAWELCPTTPGGIKVGGWLSAGYHTEPAGLGNIAPGTGLFSFNNHPNRVNLHQAWLYAEKVADGSNGPDWGFRVDGMYGTDANDTQAFGNNPGNWDFANGFDRGAGYGWAIPQAYAEFANGDWSLIAGHFFTLVGYEVVTAPDNFFYSHSYTMYNSEPFTHTGVLATYNASDSTTLYGGWTAGWDTGFDRVGGGSNFLGGFSTAVNDASTLTYITTIGDFGARGAGSGSYAHSIVLDTAINDNLNWVLQSDYVDDGIDTQYGINNYLFYTVNDALAYGLRTEWWQSDIIGDWYGITGGMNYRVHPNLILRPEVRWDRSDLADADELGFGIDAIFTF